MPSSGEDVPGQSDCGDSGDEEDRVFIMMNTDMEENQPPLPLPPPPACGIISPPAQQLQLVEVNHQLMELAKSVGLRGGTCAQHTDTPGSPVQTFCPIGPGFGKYLGRQHGRSRKMDKVGNLGQKHSLCNGPTFYRKTSSFCNFVRPTLQRGSTWKRCAVGLISFAKLGTCVATFKQQVYAT